MAQTGYTPISLYYSTTAAAVPVNTNLANGELAINITDGKLYYKDNGGTVRLLASNATSAPVLSFQTSLSGLTPSTATTGVVTLAGTLGAASGGTGLTTLATGSLTYGAGTSAFSTLAIGTAGQVLTVNSGATAPQWSTLSGVAVTTFSAGTTGFTPSSATAGAVTLAGTLATTNGGTGLTSFTTRGVIYASSTSALTNGSGLQFDGTNLSMSSPPSAWGAGTRAIEVGSGTGLWNPGSATNTVLVTNAYNDGTNYIYKSTAAASAYQQAGSEHRWLNAPSGTAGTAISFTQAMTLDASGILLVGATAVGAYGPNGLLVSKANVASTAVGKNLAVYTTDSQAANIGGSISLGGVYTSSVQYEFASLKGAKENSTSGNAQGYLAFQTTNSSNSLVERARIDSSGNVGIGTASPAGYTLHVSNATPTVRISGTSETAGQVQSLYFGTTTYNRSEIRSINVGSQGADLAFLTSPTGSSSVERMRISSTGDVGIGTTTPRSKFDVNGNVYVGASGGSVSFVLAGDTTTTGGFIYEDNTQMIISQITAAPIIFRTTNTERARIDSSGNFGVGTTSPNIGIWNKAITLNTATGNASYEIAVGGTAKGFFAADASNLYIQAFGATPMLFNVNGVERVRFDTVGNVLIGGTAARGTTVGTAHLDLFNGTAPVGTLTNGVSLYSSSGDLKFMDSAGNAYSVGFRNVPQSGSSKTASYTLATTDVGEYILLGASGAIVIPDATFAAGDVITIFNNTASTATITCSITTAYIAGTFTDKATMTLAAAGVATVLFITSTLCVVTGNVT